MKGKKSSGPYTEICQSLWIFLGIFPNFKFFKKKSQGILWQIGFLLQCEIFTQKEKAANNKLRDQN